ncbi:MAG: hypothetical protein ACI4JW_01075 [Oscillospiraceae bacterium]
MTGIDEFYCISVNYKLCGEHIRSRFSFGEEIKQAVIKNNSECSPVVLCTCGRTELYFFGDIGFGIQLLCRSAGITDISEISEIKEKLMIFGGESAVKHLFCVSSGIESMVIGEDEILGQVRKAYLFSSSLIRLSAECNMIFQAAFASAKRVKTQTDLSKSSVSTATLAAKKAARLKSSVRVLLIGASGEIGGKVLKNLLSYKNVSVAVTERKHGQRISVAPSDRITVIDYDKRYEMTDSCDCIISATTGPHYTITAKRLFQSISDGKRLSLIDLAVPRDIDPDIDECEGMDVTRIDSFEALAQRNNEIKLDSAQRSRLIIEEDADTLIKQLYFHRFLDGHPDGLSGMSAETLLYKLKDGLDPHEFAKTLDIIGEVVK